jgi:hypothetical protein
METIEEKEKKEEQMSDGTAFAVLVLVAIASIFSYKLGKRVGRNNAFMEIGANTYRTIVTPAH